MSLGLKVVIWVGVSFLYVLMFLPSLVSVTAPPAACRSPLTDLIQWIGLAIMAGALIMETVADNQKSVSRARFPKQFCNTGLYRWSRCPNYLGEILVLGRQLGGRACVLRLGLDLGGQLHWAGLHRADHAGIDEAAGMNNRTSGMATNRSTRPTPALFQFSSHWFRSILSKPCASTLANQEFILHG